MPHRFFILSYNLLLDALFPWECLFCQKESEFNYPLCKNCFLKIQIINEFICPVCQRRLFDPQKACHFSPLKALGFVGFYEDEILKETIHAFKYKKVKNLLIPLASLMIYFLKNSSYFSNLKKENLLIIPIPLFKSREKIRGFNQAKILADELAKYFNLECADNIIKRVKNNPQQAEIQDFQKRQENVKGIFRLINKEKIQGKQIILIDDVYTTGATLNEAARVLKENGAKSVIGVVLAKG